MSRRGLAIITALILFGSIIMVNGIGLGAPLPLTTLGPTATFPPATVIPNFTYSGADSVVTISDAKLKAALYTAMGLAVTSPIHKSDLAKLSGGLDLSSKSIAKADGLQYCVNITDLKLSDNKLSDLPSSFSAMTNLHDIVLDGNKFTKMPDVLFSMPALTSLSMADNQITKIADKINSLLALTNLDLSGNSITTVPTNIQKLTQLQTLNLGSNKLHTVPREMFLLPVLQSMDISGNVLAELPKEAASMPKLATLNVEGNILDSLPQGLGNAPSLVQVYAARNRLTIIEPSLLNGKITNLTLDVNRLTDLPQGLSGKTFDSFSVEWNFLNMAEGSDARKIADSVVAPSGKLYLRQLSNLASLQTHATSTTVSLQWLPLQDGTTGDGSWKVTKYQVYQVNGDTWKLLAELDKMAGEYVVTNLTPNKDYKYEVGVEYSLTLGGQKASTRFFTSADAKTLDAAATVDITPLPTDAPAATVDADATPAPTGLEPTPSDTAAAVPVAHSNTTLLVVLIILIALALVVGIGVLAMLMTRRNQRPY